MGQFDKIHSLINTAAAGVLGQTADQLAPSFDELPLTRDVMVSVDFTSKYKGKVWYIFPQLLGKDFAAGLSGLGPDELTDELVLDSIKEVCNMISSGIMLKFDARGNFKLTVPQVFVPPQIEDQLSILPENTHKFYFSCGDHNFLIMIHLSV